MGSKKNKTIFCAVQTETKRNCTKLKIYKVCSYES